MKRLAPALGLLVPLCSCQISAPRGRRCQEDGTDQEGCATRHRGLHSKDAIRHPTYAQDKRAWMAQGFPTSVVKLMLSRVSFATPSATATVPASAIPRWLSVM